VGSSCCITKTFQDPTALNRNQNGAVLSQKRSTSLPINEFNRALRSHSTITDDFPLTEGNEESIRRSGRPRGATTPSRLWTPNRGPGFDDWGGLSPRPASSQARGSHNVMGDDVQAPIGVAVTSGSHPNRRSRSLGELRGSNPKLAARRRSDEIRYWRESYDPGVLSPMSSNKAEEDPIVLDEPEQSQDSQPPPQPFNFGPMGEMAGMKITQAASLESRVQKLEKRMHEVERVVAFSRKQHSTREPLVLQDAPKRRSRRDHSDTRPQTETSEPSLPGQESYRGIQQTSNSQARATRIRSSSYGSSRPSTTSTQESFQPSFESSSFPFLSSPDHTDFTSSQLTARPLSTSTTIRGIPSSSPTQPKDSLTSEHYTALTNMILAEQSARQLLETLVRTLQLQVKKLQSRELAEQNAPGDSAFATFEQEDNSDDESAYTREDFRTPAEERSFGDEIFGPNAENRGARTLSLSKMTFKKSVQPSMNF